MSDSRIFVTTVQNEPGRVHVAMFKDHGADEKAMRKELSLGEMTRMHEILTKALWERLKRQ